MAVHPPRWHWVSLAKNQEQEETAAKMPFDSAQDKPALQQDGKMSATADPRPACEAERPRMQKQKAARLHGEEAAT